MMESVRMVSEPTPIPLESEESGGGRLFSPLRDRPSSRTNSRPKSRGQTPHKLVFPILNPLQERGKRVGRRKMRRWENDHLMCPLIPGEIEEEFDIDIAIHDIFSQEWSSMFADLSPEMLECFRKCEGEEYEKALNRFKRAVVKIKREKGAVTPRQRFRRIDKKIRHHLLESGHRMEALLRDLEQLVLPALKERSNDDVDFTLENMSPSLRAAMVEAPYLTTSTVDGKAAPAIVLSLRSSFHRLLAHGVMQFHGLRAKTTETAKGKQITVTRRYYFEQEWDVLSDSKGEGNRGSSDDSSSWEVLTDYSMEDSILKLSTCSIVDVIKQERDLVSKNEGDFYGYKRS